MSGRIEVETPRRAKRPREHGVQGYRRPPLVRFGSLLWLPALGAVVLGGYLFGTPHMRFAYSYKPYGADRYYTRCDYIGLHPQRIIPRGGKCPFIVLLKP